MIRILQVQQLTPSALAFLAHTPSQQEHERHAVTHASCSPAFRTFLTVQLPLV